ncbi:NAD(P)/FAD-dependent oxidoreductase [Salinigranum sp. GCM10025319]|uniref:NAD(P)/FAD-dependent oxidoreductase n=1 Tax=Salinigranum sp. GCM10025319 TaxID=3252687 RepID=UPI003612CD6D
MATSNLARYDVAVIGGGPAGAVAACVLQRRGRDVALLEASRYDDWRLGETLTPITRRLLVALGLGEEFDRVDAVPSHGIRSHWGQADAAVRSFLANPYGHGWHVDRQAFDRRLAEAAERAGAAVHRGTHVKACDFDAGGCSLALERIEADTSPDTDGQCSIHADGVIDATGRRSVLTRRLGGDSTVHDRLVAVAVQYRADLDTVGRYTLIEATTDGWWYSAPLPGDQLIVMWMTDADLLGGVKRRAGWHEWLNESGSTRERVAEASIVRGPKVAAATSHRLRRPPGTDRWLAVGDAALAVDPLSGSGVQRAIDTGVKGALAMDRWLDGDRSDAERYERELDDAFEEYLDRRRDYYGLETRWAERPFWRRRS